MDMTRHRRIGRFLLAALLASGALLSSFGVAAGGEAGPVTLRDQGHFYVGIDTSPPAENGSVQVKNQMYVGYQLVAEPRYKHPLVLVHGGASQSAYWFSTPDGRDGWRDYFLAAGFDVYWIDRPGFGRSPTNAEYGRLRDSLSSSIITFLARAEHWPDQPIEHTSPSVLSWLAASPPGPYAGNELAAEDLGELLQRIGPAILLTHSAGAVSGWWALNQNPGNVAGVIAIEPTASNITSDVREGLSFEPPLADDFQAVENSEGCALQPTADIHALPAFRDKPVYIVGSEMGLTSGLPCAVEAMRQVGTRAEYVYLPDRGLRGNGHFMMAETNNGEIAQVIIELAAKISRSSARNSE